MTKHLLNILIFLMLGVATLSAQDSASGEKQRQKPKTKGQDATKFVGQAVGRPGDEPFSNKGIFDNVFFYAGLGMENYGDNSLKYGTGLGGYVGFGKYINRNNSVRLQFDFLNSTRLAGESVTRMGGSLAHLYNFSSSFMGYDPNRRVEFSSIVGAGIQQVSAKDIDESQMSWRGFVGVQMKYHMNKNFDLSLEPIAALSDAKLTMIKNLRKQYVFSYGASMNVRYIINNPDFVYRSRTGSLVYGNFFTAQIGAQMHLSDMEGSMPGPTATIGMGRWIIPGLGLKLSATMGQNTWHQAMYSTEFLGTDKPYQCYESTSYMGGRLEAVFNPFVFLKGFDEEKKYQIRVSAGGEFGYLSKYNYDKPIHSTYLGYTAALQLGFRWDQDKLIYLEPRFSALTYSLPYEKINVYKNFNDNIVSLAFGMEVDQSVLPRKQVNSKLNTMFGDADKFEFSIEGGGNMTTHSRRYQKDMGFDYQLGALIQYSFNPIHHIAIHAGFNRVSDDDYDGIRQFNIINAALQYRFDLTNFMLGYDPFRKLSLQLFAGPAMGFRMGDPKIEDEDLSEMSKTKNYFGAEAGFSGRLNLSEHFGIYVAPQINLYPHDMLPNEERGWRKIVSVVLGLSFKI